MLNMNTKSRGWQLPPAVVSIDWKQIIKVLIAVLTNIAGIPRRDVVYELRFLLAWSSSPPKQT